MKDVSGVVIPRDVPLEQIFPKGISTIVFADGDIVPYVDGERCTLVSGVYHIQSHAGYGKGTSDAIEVSRELSEAHSAALAQIKRYGAGGGIVFDSDAVSKKEAMAAVKPGGFVPVKLNKTQHRSVDSVLRAVQLGELPQSNIHMIAQLTNLLNLSFQTTDFTQGAADSSVKVNTLGGQQLLQSQQQQRSAAPLRMKGYCRALIAEEVIELYRKHQDPKQSPQRQVCVDQIPFSFRRRAA